MKLYRLEYDLKWNYGIRIFPDFKTLGTRFEIFCFKYRYYEDEFKLKIEKGFRWAFVFYFKINIEKVFYFESQKRFPKQ